MSRDVSPPDAWRELKPCPVRGCNATRWTQIGLELHLLSDHGRDASQPRDVAAQLEEKDRHE